MYHITILATYMYRRQEQQMNAIDACCDTAITFGIPVKSLARFLRRIGVDANRLALIA
jgi:hypothetical protein